jgi:hypothetical protein
VPLTFATLVMTKKDNNYKDIDFFNWFEKILKAEIKREKVYYL